MNQKEKREMMLSFSLLESIQDFEVNFKEISPILVLIKNILSWHISKIKKEVQPMHTIDPWYDGAKLQLENFDKAFAVNEQLSPIDQDFDMYEKRRLLQCQDIVSTEKQRMKSGGYLAEYLRDVIKHNF